MDMEIVQLFELSWFRIPDRRLADDPPGSRDAPLPDLDWPANLFDDETSLH